MGHIRTGQRPVIKNMALGEAELPADPTPSTSRFHAEHQPPLAWRGPAPYACQTPNAKEQRKPKTQPKRQKQ
jgi:hypothetical protein